MLAVRPLAETKEVAIGSAVFSLGLAAITHVWVGSGLFGLPFFLRFALRSHVRSVGGRAHSRAAEC